MKRADLKRLPRHGGWLAALLLCAVAATAQQAQTTQAGSARVVAYVFPQGRLLSPGEIDAARVTRVNYAFANIQGGRMVRGSPSDAANFATLAALRRQHPGFTVLVSVGGWSWSGGFSDMALTPGSRQRFIDSVIKFLTLYHLDGLDVDWEYPDDAGAGHRFRRQDTRNFTLLLEELRARFDGEQRKTGRRLALTIAAGASPDYLAHTEMTRVQRSVETVNLMAYDYYEPGAEPITGNHAPLFTDPADPNKVSADASVKAFEAAGVPAGKILLGVPFYGHVWGGVEGRNHGLFQPGKPTVDGFAPYSRIVADMLGKGYVRYWDAASSAPYLYNSAQKVFVCYEDPESLAAKCRYVQREKLGGVMFWSYSDDAQGTLLRVIGSTLR